MILGDPPVLPRDAFDRKNGKGDGRRAAQISAEAESRAWARLEVGCRACGNPRVLRGSKRCWKCGAGLEAKPTGEKKRSHR